MAVQAEMGESASDASIKQVEVDGTAPISDVCGCTNVSMLTRGHCPSSPSKISLFTKLVLCPLHRNTCPS